MAHRTIILTALATLVVLDGFMPAASAQSAPSNAIAFPMIGVGFNQSLQVNVIAFPPNPCAVTVTVYGQGGEVLVAFEQGSPDRPLVIGHQVQFLPQRAEIRPDVTLTPPAGSAVACRAKATAEVFDDFTSTDWVVTPGLIPPGPTTTPVSLGPVGFTAEQTARLNVVAYPPNPCAGTIGFTDVGGNPIGSPTLVSLMPKEATFVDLSGIQAAIALHHRRPEVIGVFTPSPTTAPGSCIASVEVFDRPIGYTRVLIPPGPTQ
jgi:hypothetical protein